jgi:hypothetical protein
LAEKDAFLKTINGSLLDHLYGLNSFGKKSHYFFCPKKKQFGALKRAGNDYISTSNNF